MDTRIMAETTPFEASTPVAPWQGNARAAVTKNYVLIGHDMDYTDKAYSARGDVNIIRAREGQSLEDAVKTITPPANILLMAHGELDGTFLWNRNQMLPYAELFAALPREGMDSFTLISCYGGTAIADAFLKVAPPGMLVQSMVGPYNLSSALAVEDFIHETKGEINPVQLLLKSLDNFHPRDYQITTEYFNKKLGTSYDSNPENALPHTIGLGGNPPMQIHLDAIASQIHSTIKTNVDRAAWRFAIEHVMVAFDTRHHIVNPQNPDGPSLFKNGGENGQLALEEKILAIADTMRRGEPLGGETPVERADNKRIAYAITAAFLDESGMLAQWQQQQQNTAKAGLNTR
jgi:hypothetical protein